MKRCLAEQGREERERGRDDYREKRWGGRDERHDALLAHQYARREGLPAGPVAGLDDPGARSALDDRSTNTDIIDMIDNKKNIPTSSISHTSRQSVVSSPKKLTCY